MCWKTPSINTNVPSAPQRDPNSLLGRLFARRAPGVNATIATSPLGDLGFGKNTKKPTLLGQTDQTAPPAGSTY